MTPARFRHRAEDFVLRGLAGFWSLVPERAALWSGAALGLLVGSALRVRRRDVDHHLAWAFPERSRAWRARVARGSYAHLGREAVVMFRSGGWSAEQVIERTAMVGFDAFRAAAESGTGLVVLTGHVGNWEIGGAAIAARGVPFDVVGKGMSNRGFQADLFAAREGFGMRVIEMGDAAREASRALRQGRVVALLGDQHAHDGGISVPFFGRPASTTRGPALLAGGAGVPVWVAFALRDPGSRQTYTVSFEPLPFSPTGRGGQDAAALMSAYAKVLEDVVRSAPEQYFWHHRRWKKPPGEEPASEG